MDIDNLVNMANRIGEFFEATPDREEALSEIALHLQKFWEPRMRRALLRHLETSAPTGLMPIVAEALKVHRRVLEPAAAA